MTITSIGSSFSYIRPDAASRGAAASAASEAAEAASSAPTPTGGSTAAAPSPPGEAGRKPSVADEMQAILVKAQESHGGAPSAASAARAYGGR